MTLHFHWLHLPRRLARAHGDRALALVLGVIGVSLLFGALRVVDAAISGALVSAPRVAAAPAASGAAMTPELLMGSDPTGAGVRAEPATLDETPDAVGEAVSL